MLSRAIIAPRDLIRDTPEAQRIALLFDHILVWQIDRKDVGKDEAARTENELTYLREQGLALKVGFEIPPIISFQSADGTSWSPFDFASKDCKMPDYAWGYRKDRPVRVNEGPLDEQAYGVKTTVSDLLRFVQANIDPSSLEPSMRRAVEATQVGYFRAGTLVQGLGWEKCPYPVSREWLLGGNAKEMLFDPQPAYRLTDQTAGGQYLFNKTGSTGGFATYVALVPARKIGIVMLANRSYPIPDRVEAAWMILEQLASGTDSNSAER